MFKERIEFKLGGVALLVLMLTGSAGASGNPSFLQKQVTGYTGSKTGMKVRPEQRVRPAPKGMVLQKGMPVFPSIGEGKIRFHVESGPLCDSLAAIEEQFHVHYTCPSSLDGQQVQDRVIQGDSVADVVRELLKDYNTVEIWNDDRELASVYLVGLVPGAVGGGVVSKGLLPKRPDANKAVKSKAVNRHLGTPGGGLSQIDIHNLILLPSTKPLPDEMFHNPDMWNLWQMAKIELPGDWMETEKSSKVKRHLRHLLKIKKREVLRGRLSRNR